MKIVIAACILESPDRAKSAVSLHWRQDVSETEIRGVAVEAAEKDRPDWRIAQVVVATIPQEFVLAPKPQDQDGEPRELTYCGRFTGMTHKMGTGTPGYWVCGKCDQKFATLTSAQNHPCCQPSAPSAKGDANAL